MSWSPTFAANRQNLCTASVMLSIGSIPLGYASDPNYHPSVSHYGLLETVYVVSDRITFPDTVDSAKGDTVTMDCRCIPWTNNNAATSNEVMTISDAQLRLTHGCDRHVMILRNGRASMPRKLLDVFSFDPAVYDLDIPVLGTRMELKEGDALILKTGASKFYANNLSSRVGTAQPLQVMDDWSVFVCLPPLLGIGCEPLRKHGVCRNIRERVEAFVATWEAVHCPNAGKVVLRPNPARVQAYKLSDAFPFLERHTGRAYFTGETPSDEDDEGTGGATDVVSFSALTVVCVEGGRAKKNGGGARGAASDGLPAAKRPCP